MCLFNLLPGLFKCVTYVHTRDQCVHVIGVVVVTFVLAEPKLNLCFRSVSFDSTYVIFFFVLCVFAPHSRLALFPRFSFSYNRDFRNAIIILAYVLRLRRLQSSATTTTTRATDSFSYWYTGILIACMRASLSVCVRVSISLMLRSGEHK